MVHGNWCISNDERWSRCKSCLVGERWQIRSNVTGPFYKKIIEEIS